MQKEMTHIESLEFSAQMNVCSGFMTILSGLQTEESVKNLLAKWVLMVIRSFIHVVLSTKKTGS